jgi:hypothetical protein
MQRRPVRSPRCDFDVRIEILYDCACDFGSSRRGSDDDVLLLSKTGWSL